jgi:hypothetical protein
LQRIIPKKRTIDMGAEKSLVETHVRTGHRSSQGAQKAKTFSQAENEDQPAM